MPKRRPYRKPLRPVVEQHPCIDANELNRLGAFKIGHRVRFDIMGIAATRNAIEVYRPRGLSTLTFPVQWTHCHFGGWRPWLVCLCGRRVAKLYYFGGINLGCRPCAGLSFTSQRKTRNGRLIQRAKKLRARLGDYEGTPGISPFPARPYRMKRRTFSKLVRKCAETEQKIHIRNPARGK